VPWKVPGWRQRKRLLWALGLVGLGLAAVGAVAYGVYASRPSVRARKLAEKAGIHRGLGDRTAAAEALEAALALDPDVPERAVRLAELRAGLGDDAAAEAVLERARDRLPENRLLTVALARHLVRARRAARAVEVLAPFEDEITGLPAGRERTEALVIAGLAHAGAGDPGRGEALLVEAAAAGPEDARAEALVHLARLRRRVGRLDGAEGAVRDALRLAPEDRAAALELARILDASGRSAQALEQVRALFAAGGPGRLGVAEALGELLLTAGRVEAARDLADELAGLEGGLPVATYLRGAIAAREGAGAEATEAYARLAELRPDSPAPHLLRARQALRDADPAAAAAAYAAALERRPGLDEAELGLLALAERRGDRDAVRERAEALLASPRTRPRALCALLLLHARGGEPAAGVSRLEALAAQEPDDPWLRIYLAVLRLLAREPAGAAELEAVARRPDLDAALGLLAGSHVAQADALEAIELLAAVAAREPAFAPARLVLARLYERLGRLDLAVREVETALAAEPPPTGARAARARLAVRQGDLNRAAAELERVLAAPAPGPDDVEDAEDPAALTALAEVRLRQGAPAAAVGLLERAVAAAPDDARARARLGRARALAGDDAQALAAFGEARRLGPSLPAAHQHGALYLERGELGEARTALEAGLEATGFRGFALALAAVEALAGNAQRAVDLLRRAREATPEPSPEALLLEAALLGRAGRPAEARSVPRHPAVPPEVRAAALALADRSFPDDDDDDDDDGGDGDGDGDGDGGDGDGGDGGDGDGGDPDERRPLPLGLRLALELFGLRAVGWRAELAPRVEAALTGHADEAPDPLLLWSALRAAPPGDAATRRGLLRRLAPLCPSDPAVALDLIAHEAAADPADRLLRLRPLAERFPDDPRVALHLARALEESGRRADAVTAYLRAVEGAAEPDPTALNNLAYLLADDPAERPRAIEAARRAVRLAPDAAPLRDTLGWVLYRDGQLEAAERQLVRAAALRPSHPTIRYHLAAVLAAAGRPERAQGHLRIALLQGEAFPERAAAEALLAEVGGAESGDRGG